MSGGKRREPVKLILAKNKTHMSKRAIEKRLSEELDVPFKDIETPSYLNAKQQKEFNEYAFKLKALDIFTELDVDILAQFVLAKTLYLKYCDQIKTVLSKDDATREWKIIDKLALNCDDQEELVDLLEKILRRQRTDEISSLMSLQDKAFKQCVTCARELGLTITSRAKLVIPTPPDDGDDEL